MILSNLGQRNLLSCRLVNQSWNWGSLLVFRKSSFRIHLNIYQAGGNAEKYTEFASTKNPQLILPIHLSVGNFERPHPKTLEIVTSLQRLSGPDSVQSLTLDIWSAVEDKKTVVTLLSKISHASKTLDVKYYSLSRTDPFLYVSMKDLVFPNVTALKYLIGTKYGSMQIQCPFILMCANLTELYLESESKDVTFPQYLQKLVMKAVTDKLQFRNNILECSHLNTLKIYKYESGDRQTIVSILESLSKTLKSLTIGVHTDTMFQFPQLPYLESLRLHNMTKGLICTIVGLNLDDMNLNSETFPSLKLVRFPFLFYIRNGSPLPSVKSLIFLVLANLRDPYNYSGISIQENFKNLTRIFPNATTVSLKQGIPDTNLFHRRTESKFQCKTVLKELITSELAPQIKQIKIDGVSTDILGEILEHNMIPPEITMKFSGHRNYEAEDLIQKAFGLWTGDFEIEGIQCNDEGAGLSRRVMFTQGCPIGHKMTNIKKVKMLFTRRDEDAGEIFLDLRLNLTSISKSLTSLTEIELIAIERELHSKQFDNLAIEYPNILLRITKLGPKKQYGKK